MVDFFLSVFLWLLPDQLELQEDLPEELEDDEEPFLGVDEDEDEELPLPLPPPPFRRTRCSPSRFEFAGVRKGTNIVVVLKETVRNEFRTAHLCAFHTWPRTTSIGLTAFISPVSARCPGTPQTIAVNEQHR